MSAEAALRLTPASIAHAAVMVRLHALCFDDAWSLQAMSDVLNSPGAFAAIATVDEGPVGFVLARIVGDEAEVLTLCVIPDWRRRGVAAQLLAEAMRRARAAGAARIFLEVAETNEAARALYAGRGFAAVGRRPDYYRLPNRVPVAALTLRRDLKGVTDV